MRNRSHLGTSFEAWNGRHAWFWFVSDTQCNGAAIGAAANKAEAIREARTSIEEMSRGEPKKEWESLCLTDRRDYFGSAPRRIRDVNFRGPHEGSEKTVAALK